MKGINVVDYKETLNLPETSFPMRGDLAKREPERLKKWQDQNLYGQIREQAKGAQQYILHDGPPYGHAVNKILKDMIIKSKSFDGMDAPYIPGWDCHGLPIEHQVELKHGKVGVKLDSRAFRQACREYASQQVEGQKSDFIRLGVLGDWDRPYLTMDFKTEADTLRVLAKIVENGHLVRGFKPVHWCAECGSSLAEAEVEYENKQSPAIDVMFDVVEPDALYILMGISEVDASVIPAIVIWTTTPWTLPGNQAVCLHPDLEYVLVEFSANGAKRRVVLAEALLEASLKRYGAGSHVVLARMTGAQLEGMKLAHPFMDRVVPVILGDHVTTEAGTGAVHTAPGHGVEDFIVGKKYGLSVDNPVGPNGCFVPSLPYFGGQFVFKANGPVTDLLKERDKLLCCETIAHSYPHCWRHKTPLIFRATPQWFISMEKAGLRQDSMAAIRSVEWIPEWGEARIAGMVEKSPDWCVSRQRNWGVPIAMFIHKETQEPHPDTVALMEKAAQRIEQEGVEVWFDLDPAELLGNEADDYEKVTDILDVWFDSGATHFSVMEQRSELGYPADLYLEGSDQHRGWFQTSLRTAMAMRGSPPYRTVLTHGFVVDASGEKMAKSKGNVILPQTVMNRLGADVLRLWVAATDYTAEMRVSDEILNRTSDSYRRIRNTSRFLLANLNGFDPSVNMLSPDALLPLDAWAVDAAWVLQNQIREAYRTFHFHKVYQLVQNFCSIEMGSFYLDVIKDRQYTAATDSVARRSAQTAMYHIVEALCRWIAPILSFTAEEIWEAIPGHRGQSIFLNRWYEGLFALPETTQFNRAFWQSVHEIREQAVKAFEPLRSAKQIGSSLDAEMDLYLTPELFEQTKCLGEEWRFILITSAVHLHEMESKPADLAQIALPSGGAMACSVRVSEHPKCVRCWHHRHDVGCHPEHPDICERCVINVTDASGEQRQFA
jgi:isoleucyl-tRNA synthetase